VRLRSCIALLALVLAAGFVRPAAADITVTTHYTFLGGDTLTRDSYYSNKRIRVTGPDGKEFMFNAKTDTVTVIDHATRRYWTGPRALADSLAAKLIAENRAGVPEEATADPVAWARSSSSSTTRSRSSRLARTGRSRVIRRTCGS
jgi:hypothetical protein